jgi:hypothetical protein
MLLVAALALAAGPALAQTKQVDDTVPLEAGGSLYLDAGEGSVSLTAWDRNEVEIKARIESDRDSDREYAARAIEATRVDIDRTGTRVTIRSNYRDVPTPSGWRDSGSRHLPNVHYEIRAPKRLDLQLDIDRSPTKLAGFEGRLVLEFDRSPVEASDLAGQVSVSIDRGARSTFTNVRAAFRLEADRTNVDVGFARLESASSIEVDRGDVNLTIAAGQGLDVSAAMSRRASFETDLPMTVTGKISRSASGSINGGGPRLSIEGDRARVRLSAS